MGGFLKVGVGAAVLLSSVVGIPAFDGTPLGVSEAHADGRYYRRHRRGDNFDFGDAVIGAVVVGGLIAVLSGAKKRDEDRDRDRPLDSGWEPRGDWGRSDDWSWRDSDWQNRTAEERAAIGTCAREAEDLGSRYGREARVREIGDVDRDGAEYRVKGSVDVRGGDPRYDRPDDRDDDRDDDRRDDGRALDRDDTRTSQEFICYVRADRISDFRFLEGYAAR